MSNRPPGTRRILFEHGPGPLVFGRTRVSRGYVTPTYKIYNGKLRWPSFDPGRCHCQQIWTMLRYLSIFQQNISNRKPLSARCWKCWKMTAWCGQQGSRLWKPELWLQCLGMILILIPLSFLKECMKFRSRNSHNSETMTSKM